MRPIAIRFGRLGDMVLLAPILHRLHARYGETCVLLGTGPWSAALYAGHPDVAAVVQVTARHRPLLFSPQRWHMLRVLRANRGAPVYVCETEPRALIKIRRMLALARMDASRCVFITDLPSLPEEHWADRLLRLAAQTPTVFAGEDDENAGDNTNAAPCLYVDDADRADRDAWLAARGIAAHELILVQPANKRSMRWNGARDPADDDKSWPRERWVALLRLLAAQNPDARILLCGAPPEAPLLEGIANAIESANVIVAARDLPLRRLMAVAEIARAMISVDTGPAHVAAALGCPLVVLFGAQSPRVWQPRSATGGAVIALGGPPRSSRVADIALADVSAAWGSLPPRE
ncbi:MAG: glycosyltransferase family 9 protein [Rhodanobacteraceae bacterium]